MAELPFGKLMPSDAYAKAYVEGYGFEAVCARARQQRNVAFLRDMAPAAILEVGCGPMLLATMPGAAGLPFARWAIVEPAMDFANTARQVTAGDARFAIVDGFLEERLAPLAALAPDGYDAIVVSGVVSETSQPVDLLKAAASLLSPRGRVLVSCANALSFHRLLSVASGLTTSPHELSPMNRKLGQYEIFDRASLTRLMQAAGLTDLTFDGYLFKPFTNAQLEALTRDAGEAVIDGLIALGRQFPENAAEICMTGRKA